MTYLVGIVGGLITLGAAVKVIGLVGDGRSPAVLLIPLLAYVWAQIIFHMYRTRAGYIRRLRNLLFIP